MSSDRGRSFKEYGNEGEDLAAAFLLENNFEILSRNFRYGRYGEIDIIARRGDLVLFIEVKRRRSKSFGGALYAITKKKRAAIRKTAEFFLQNRKLNQKEDITCRFDMISIENDDIHWIEDIFR